MTRTRLIAVAAAVVLLGGGIGVGWALNGAARDRATRAEQRARAAAASASAVGADRDRIKADRDRLEAQLAAQSAPPKACPEETRSTANAHLGITFAVDYPCGWHLIGHPNQSFAADNSDRKGRLLDQLLLNASPISFAPSEGPLTDISLDSWSDDANTEGDALPSLADWLANARKRFSNIKESTLTTRSGLVVTRIAGDTPLFEEPVPALLYVWEWTDRNGRRIISEAFALRPGPIVTRTLAALVRSFRVLGA